MVLNFLKILKIVVNGFIFKFKTVISDYSFKLKIKTIVFIKIS